MVIHKRIVLKGLSVISLILQITVIRCDEPSSTQAPQQLKQYLKWLGSRVSAREFRTGNYDDSFQIFVPVVKQVDSTRSHQQEASLSTDASSGQSGQFAHSRSSTFKPLSNDNSPCTKDIPEWGIHYRVHKEDGKCYIPVKGENPCPLNMQFYLTHAENSVYGECDCQIYAGDGDRRPLIYSSEANQCFHLFDRGPCKPDEWLTLNDSNEPLKASCTKRSCPSSNSSLNENEHWILYNNACYKLFSPGFCIGKDEILQFAVEGKHDAKQVSHVPKCFRILPKISKKSVYNVLALPCRVGHKNYNEEACKMVPLT